tara:strand:+ start:4854 stop:5492 length:639 start_codon:yes stop_codon:yes gene_type:complete
MFEVVCFVLMAVLSLFFTNIFKGAKSRRAGNCGESLVKRTLAKYCNNSSAHVLNNVTLRLGDGSTTQIDHILISAKGIFVIETKHFSGWIFANANSKMWTQIIYKVKNTFQNPIFQNYKHVSAIKKLFPTLSASRLIHNIVVFTGDAEFKTAIPYNVFHLDELVYAIEQYSGRALSLGCIQHCVDRLEKIRLELTRKTDAERRAHLRQKFSR